MPPLVDPEMQRVITTILGNWRYSGYVTAKDEAQEWAGKNLPGFTLRALAKLMHDHVSSGGAIDQVSETRRNGTIGPFIMTSDYPGRTICFMSKPCW